MRPVVTLTCNLLGEFTAEYPRIQLGKTQRAQRMSFQVGGKGINVAKMAQRLGAPATAVYYSGGPGGDWCDGWLARQAFAVHRLDLPGETRMGWVARSPEGPETSFLGQDTPLDLAASTAAIDDLCEQRQATLVMAGSIPGWTPAFFDALAARWSQLEAQGCQLALDTYGPPLRDLAALPFHWIKINRTELLTLPEAADRPELDTPSILRRLVQTRAAAQWIVSDGPGAVHYADRSGTAGTVVPPTVQEVSAVGSGDVLLAGLIVLHQQGLALRPALERAVRWASANAAHPGVAEFDLDA